MVMRKIKARWKHRKMQYRMIRAILEGRQVIYKLAVVSYELKIASDAEINYFSVINSPYALHKQTQ